MAIRKDLYDAAHRRFGALLFDRQGRPARYGGCYTGVTCPEGAWDAVRIVRSANGSATANQFFDEAGQPTETTSCTTHPCFD